MPHHPLARTARLLLVATLACVVVSAPPGSVGGKAPPGEARPRPTDFSTMIKELKMRPQTLRVREVGKASPDEATKAKLSQMPYYVVVINRSKEYVIVGYRMGNGSAVMVQPIPQTCDLADCDACRKKGYGQPLAVVPCNSEPFDLFLIVKDSKGQLIQVPVKDKVRPSCEFEGEPVCLDV